MSRSKMNYLFSSNFLFVPPHELKFDRESRIISLAFAMLFLLISLGFSIPYAVISFKACSENLVLVDYFVENSTCNCRQNVGISPVIANLIIANSSFGSQFTQISPSGYNVEMVGPNGFSYVIITPFIGYFFDNVYPIVFTNTLTNITLKQFQLYDQVFDTETAKSLFPFNHTCLIFISPNETYTEEYTFDTEADCLNLIRTQIDPNYNDVLQIDYVSNPVYANFCDLQNCAVPTCLPLTAFNNILFIASAISFFYLVLRFLHSLFFRFWKIDNEKVSEQIALKGIYVLDLPPHPSQ